MKTLTIKEKKMLLFVAVAALFVTVIWQNGNIVALAASNGVELDNVTQPIIGLINDILGPLIAIVGAVGTLYCVLLGVKFAKAEEPQEREKAKAHLRNAIVGFVLIFVLVVALRQLLPIMSQWMTKQMQVTTTTQNK